MREIDLLGGLYPPERFFHKPRGDPANFGIVKITPHVAPLVKNFEALEYVTRNMFISRTQSWRKGVTCVPLRLAAIQSLTTDRFRTFQWSRARCRKPGPAHGGRWDQQGGRRGARPHARGLDRDRGRV